MESAESSADSGEGTDSGDAPPTDDVLLEEPEESAASEGSGENGGEDAVLESAIEAMESAGQSGEQEGSAGSASSSGDASEQAGAQAAGTDGREPSLDSVREALDRANGNGSSSGSAELDALNRELNESLAEFDGALINSRQQRQATRDETGDSGYGEEEDAVAIYEDPAGTDGGADTGEATYAPPMPSGGGGGGSGGSGGVPNAEMVNQGEGSASSAANNVPADIPDGSDDDVVARQIREAAMNESDPELREKLWEEYRKYTNAQKRTDS